MPVIERGRGSNFEGFVLIFRFRLRLSVGLGFRPITRVEAIVGLECLLEVPASGLSQLVQSGHADGTLGRTLYGARVTGGRSGLVPSHAAGAEREESAFAWQCRRQFGVSLAAARYTE